MGKFSCTTIIVGNKASNNGSIILARNDDGGLGNNASRFIYHSPMRYGYLYQNIMDLNNKFKYQLPNKLLGYSGLPAWQSHNKSFEEAGFNDVGVGMSATETIFSNNKVLENDPYLKDGVSEEAIITIILPQIKTAKEGVKCLGNIIENYGSAEGFGVGFADKYEAWYLENAGGHNWVALRIPNDKYFISANQSRIGIINFKDKKNILMSKNLINFARDSELYKSGDFNFR